jgi:hypothetical protein
MQKIIELTSDGHLIASNIKTSFSRQLPHSTPIKKLFKKSNASTPKEYFCAKVILFWKILQKTCISENDHWTIE